MPPLERTSCIASFKTVALGIIAAFVLPAAICSAANTVVTVNDDSTDGADGVISLREAITAANSSGGTQTITFDSTVFPPAGAAVTIQLNSALPDIDCDLTITGPGANVLIIQGLGQATPFRFSRVLAGRTVSISGVTIKNFFNQGVNGLTGATPTNGSQAVGGAMYNLGTLNLTECVFANNECAGGSGGSAAINTNTSGRIGGDGYGGAIYSDGTALNIIRCTFSQNTARGGDGGDGADNSSLFGFSATGAAAGKGKGGAIYVATGTCAFTNSTFAGNVANGGSGGNGGSDIFSPGLNQGGAGGNGEGGAIYTAQPLTLTSCTVAQDAANAGQGGSTSGVTGIARGGGLNAIGTITLGNCLIAGNSVTGGQGPDLAGTFTSQNFNLIGALDGNASGINGSADQYGSKASPLDPGLDPNGLADNGGPTPTIALTKNSRAIDAGMAMGGVTTDQRGLPRFVDLAEDTNTGVYHNATGGDGSDIGAFEFQGTSISITADQASKVEGNGNGTTAFTFTVSRVGSTNGAASVNYAVTGSSGNPADAADFGGTLPSGTVTIPDTQASTTLTINVSQDALFEFDEEFTVTISNPPAGHAIGTAAVSSIITNDDAPGISIAADQASKAEGTGSGTTAFTFTVSRAGSTSGAVTVDYAVTGSSGNPADAADFGGTLPSGTVTIQDTQASATLTINVSQDATVESDEEFTVTLSNPNAGYVITTAAATSIITNDDASSNAGTVQITSGPTATPNPAAVGQAVTFTVAASDSNNGTLSYTWDIAGTAATGVAPQMAFNAPGTYTASVIVDNGAGGTATGSVQVTVVAPAVGAGADSDGDGFSDEFEIAAGTNPSNAADSPTGGVAPTTAALTITKVSAKLNFAKTASDSISFSGTLPVPANYSAASKTITVDFGGVVKAITLDEKGKSKLLSLKIKSTKGVVAAQTSKLGVKLLKGDFGAALQDEGLVNGDLTAASATVTVRVIFAGVIYEKAQPLSYSAKKDKTGKAIPPKN